MRLPPPAVNDVPGARQTAPRNAIQNKKKKKITPVGVRKNSKVENKRC